jgi:hypothetical protein
MTETRHVVLEIALDDIAEDDGAQMRVAGIDPAIVTEYAEAFEAGAVFPPVILFHDGGGYFPTDGFHRIAAARKIGRSTIASEVRQGTRRDAIMFAVGANANHGLRRTQADRRKAVETLLKDPEWTRLSDRKIGEAAKVDHKTVARIRREFSGGDDHMPPSSRMGKSPAPAVPDQVGNSPPTSLVQQMLRTLSDDALIAECQRRVWRCRNDARL